MHDVHQTPGLSRRHESSKANSRYQKNPAVQLLSQQADLCSAWPSISQGCCIRHELAKAGGFLPRYKQAEYGSTKTSKSMSWTSACTAQHACRGPQLPQHTMQHDNTTHQAAILSNNQQLCIHFEANFIHVRTCVPQECLATFEKGWQLFKALILVNLTPVSMNVCIAATNQVQIQ